MAVAAIPGGLKGRKPSSIRRAKSTIFLIVCLAATLLGISSLLVLLVTVGSDGIGRLSWDFLNSYPSRFAGQAGIRSAFLGTLWLMGLTAAVAVPLGVGAAIYLEEFAPKNWFTKIIEVNINNLAGVPSIIYGLLGLTLFVRVMDLGRSVLAGSLTMALLVLPIIIVASREGLRAVPPSLREGALAVGATPWQAVRFQVLGPAMPTILTGIILALSRAIGETAPLIMIGALTFVAFDPSGPLSPFTVLPIQVFNWTSRPQAGFVETAAAGIVVLMVVLLSMNAVAILLRNYFEGKKRW
jgi:phosphate transport system permease protein